MKVIHHDIGRDALYKTWHTIEGNMIIYTYTEGGNIVFQDKIYPIKKGTLCFIGADKHHYTMPDKPATYDRSKIIISEDTVRGFLNLFPESDDFCNLFANNSVIYAKIPSELECVIEETYKEAQDAINLDVPDIQTVVCSFFRLMTYVKKYTIEQTGLSNDFMTRAIAIINQNYSQQIKLDEICEAMHISKYYFCRKFKNIMGITAMEYILKTRLAAAKNMLKSENCTISQVSEKCGFSSFSYFCQIFKQNFGMTALEYRKKYREKTDKL